MRTRDAVMLAFMLHLFWVWSIGRLEENAAAAKLRLSDDELQRIDRLLTTHVVVGTRYAAAAMGSVNAESAARRQ
jgi:aryl-alcohol dehydrogenase-like predicted oxidoreductase